MATKTADRQEVCKKLHTQLKKHYSVPKNLAQLPVLESMLFAVCLEDATYESAHTAFQKLLSSFHDLNEIRVSSIEEIENSLIELPDPEFRSLRIKSVLQAVFEQTYSFEFEVLKKKTQDLAVKQLNKIKTLTPFVRNYTLQHCLGAHVLPLDDSMMAPLRWLELIPIDATHDQASDLLRASVRKSDGSEFVYLLRAFSLDKKPRGVWEKSANMDPAKLAEHLAKLPSPMERLDRALKGEPVSETVVANAPRKDKAAAGNKSQPDNASATPKGASAKGKAAPAQKKPAKAVAAKTPKPKAKSPPAKAAKKPAKAPAPKKSKTLKSAK